MAKKKIKTYEVYIVNCGYRHTYLTTTDKKRAVRVYSRLCYTGALPRISIDGVQLTIEEATRYNEPTIGSHARRPETGRTRRGDYSV